MVLERCILFSILFSCLLASNLFSQATKEDIDVIKQDSIGAPIERGVLKSIKTIFGGEPGRVALYGLLIPSGGQIYNKKYWKVPIVLAAEGATIGVFIYLRNEYKQFQKTHALVVNGKNGCYRGICDERSLRTNRNNFRLNMERAGFGIAAIHLLSVIEAFTDAHLKEFDIDEDLSFQIKQVPTPYSGPQFNIGLKMTLR